MLEQETAFTHVDEDITTLTEVCDGIRELDAESYELLPITDHDKGLLLIAITQRIRELKLNKPQGAINPMLWEGYFNEIARLTELLEVLGFEVKNGTD